MNFDKFNALQEKKPNLREMADASAVGDYKNQGCGDGYRIFLKVNDRGVIEDASFTTTGCGFGLAALSLVCEVAKGRTIAEAEKITAEEIERGVDGFPERRKNYPQSALEAFHVALENLKSGRKDGLRPVTREEVVQRLAAGESLANVDGQHADLSGLDLKGARLEGGNWSGANLERADLSGANLHKCVLRGVRAAGANFTGASLRRADLFNADLRGADFTDADLRNSFLNDSDLRTAVFARAQLGFAKLTGTKIDGTKFSGAFYDMMTRFDPGVVAPFEVMEKRDDPGAYFEREQKPDEPGSVGPGH